MKKIAVLVLALSLSFIGKSQNEFTFDMYAQMNAESNILFSPTSIKTAFAMAYEGANGSTQKEFEKVFGFTEDNSKFLREIEQLKEVAEMSNSVWILENFEILQSYTDKIEVDFHSKPYTAKFDTDPQGSADKINDWIEESTNGMIKKMLTAKDVEKFKMALVNAIYFKQDWKRTFEKELTQKRDFYNLGGDTLKVDMMHAQSRYFAYSGQNEKVIQLPYADDKTSMVIILPNDMKGYELTDEIYAQLNSNLRNQEVILDLPKFTFETSTFDLKPIMKGLGMIEAFEDSAIFTGMREENDLKIGKALHKAKIIVNEEGTEAAAVTVIGMEAKTTSMAPQPRPILRIQVDKPFFYFIKDNASGAILFMGRMNTML